jgi:protein-S-isoprenylcysteine O-methyltransferase Ste14
MVPAAFVVRYLYKNDLKLLERRMRMRETQKTQKIIQTLSWPFFLSAFILPGLDVRFHWSNVPFPMIIIADVMVLLGYLIIALVFRANSYASRIVEVEKGQKVISTGPYSVVRHPMYSEVIIFYTFSPLALGSYWAMIPALLIVPLLVFRIKGEEKKLLENLEGYKEYVMKTRYRLVLVIW